MERTRPEVYNKIDMLSLSGSACGGPVFNVRELWQGGPRELGPLFRPVCGRIEYGALLLGLGGKGQGRHSPIVPMLSGSPMWQSQNPGLALFIALCNFSRTWLELQAKSRSWHGSPSQWSSLLARSRGPEAPLPLSGEQGGETHAHAY